MFTNIHRIVLFVAMFLALKAISYSSVEVSFSGFGYVLGPHGEPTIGCEIWATQNGTPLILTTENTKIIQSKVAIIDNLNISVPDQNGHQTFTWGLKIGLPHDIEFEVLVTSNQELGTVPLPGLPEFQGYAIACYQQDYYGYQTMIQRMDFTNDWVNQHEAYLLLSGNANTAGPIPTRPFVDSITCTNPNITHDCWPVQQGIKPPPAQMQYGVLYKITARYNEPAGHPYMRGWFIVHLAGGVKYRIEIVAHEPKIENTTLMKLLSPLGGEKFSPCEEVLIQWQGHNPSHPTSIEFSPDGEKWEHLRNIPGDSASYLWKVPPTISDYCFIRVSQQRFVPARKRLKHDEATIRSAVFCEINNDIANKILTASSANNIVEWDVAQTPVRKITAINTGDSSAIACAIYTDKSRIVALDARNNALLFYNSGDVNLQKSVPLPAVTGFVPHTMKCDNLQRFIMLQPEPEYGNTLVFIDTAGNYITKLTENLPFTAVHLAENKLYYALIDNTIKSVSLSQFPDFVNTEQFDFAKDYNLINTFSVSRDDNMLAVACRQQTSRDNSVVLTQQGDNLIFDKRLGSNGMIFRNLKVNTWTNLLLDFSPAGTIAVIASAKSPQIMFNDLSNLSNTQWQNDPINNLQGVTLSRTGNALIAYSAGDYNTNYIPFALPEWQMNTKPFSIVAPALGLAVEASAQLPDMLIGTSDTVILPLQLCNTGLSKIEITEAQFADISHLELDNSQMTYPLVLAPGECTTLYIIAHPRDTGLLTVPLQFVDTCQTLIEIPFYIRGIDRKLTLFADTIDFGINCINDTITLTNVALFRNDDTVDVVINDIVSYYPNFAITSYNRDTILRPGDIFVATLIFMPGAAVGDYSAAYTVYYAGQWAVVRYLAARARTVGIQWNVSHRELAFVPEVPSRTFIFTNTGDAEVTINGVSIEPVGLYSTTFAGPVVVLPGDSLQITVTCHSFPAQDATLMFATAPCLSGDNTVKLTAYSGSAHVWIPAMQADVRDANFNIPIYFTQREAPPYRGSRVFEGIIELRGSLFYPNGVSSSHGAGEIVSNSVIRGLRRIHFRVTGDFSGEDSVLCFINGVCMLGDTTFTSVNWSPESALFGQNVASTVASGSLDMSLLCEDRFAGAPADLPPVNIVAVFPQPATDFLTVDYEVSPNIKSYLHSNANLSFKAIAEGSPWLPVAAGEQPATLELYDMSGGLLFFKELFFTAGRGSLTLDVSGLPAGSYVLSVTHIGQRRSVSVIKY